MLSEAKRDRARHAQRAERSSGLQGGYRAGYSGVQGRSPGGGLGGRSPRKILRK